MVLMVRLFWVFFFLGFGLAVSAQDDPVLMRINGKEVLRSEFERSYNKGGTSVGAGRKALDAYVNKFIDFRLKIEAAEVVGLDTSRVFQKELMSSLDIVCSYDFMINCDGIDYSMEEMQMCSIADLCLEKNDMFLLSFFDSETDEFYPITGKLLNEELNDKEIELERIQVIETKNDGPWVEENERRSLNEQNEQLVSGFFFNKMFYERPDLFEELENGKDIEELLFQMIDEELNDDIYDTEYMN